jgi:hypothetical protein
MVALLVACVVASAITGALLYQWFAPANEHARTQSTTAQEPAPVQEPPAEPTPVPAHESAHRERRARPDSQRPAPGRRSHSSSSSDRRKPGLHVVPDAKIIEIE